MIRHITADLHQIAECVAGAQGHEAVCVYVLLNHGHPILIDCGSQLHRAEMLRQLETVLAGNAPEYIFLTHSELPHAGNLQKIAEKFSTIQVLVSSVMLPYIEIAPIPPLSQIISVLPGTTREFAGRKLVFLDALLRDQPGSQWIYDADTRTLFSGDGFGYYHTADMCDSFSDELPDGIPLEAIEEYHRNAFRFLQWVVPERFARDLHELFRRRDIKVIAPTHGNAIRSDIPLHVERLERAVENICLYVPASVAA